MGYIVIGSTDFNFYVCTYNESFEYSNINYVITDDEFEALSIIIKNKTKIATPEKAIKLTNIIGTYEITPLERLIFSKMGMRHSNKEAYDMLKSHGLTNDNDPELNADMERAGYGVEWLAYKLFNLESNDRAMGV
jgi:hypothetical protein